MDVLVLGTMKNAAKCDNSYEMQKSWKMENLNADGSRIGLKTNRLEEEERSWIIDIDVLIEKYINGKWRIFWIFYW